MTKQEKFELANNFDLTIAITEAIHEVKPEIRNPFHTIGDRIKLIDALEQYGFTLVKKNK